ncbi:hypothetical protein CGRA01v4_05667 [Colletotrichum graminicola]|nr:hypothetical protein CGRA01v4_05667 [Colletotrichum graminicola]
MSTTPLRTLFVLHAQCSMFHASASVLVSMGLPAKARR